MSMLGVRPTDSFNILLATNIFKGVDRSRFTRHMHSFFWLRKKEVAVSWETGGGREGGNVLCNFNRVSTPPVYERERKREGKESIHNSSSSTPSSRPPSRKKREKMLLQVTQ